MNSLRVSVKENWKSGLAVALVSLPMSLSLGMAAGATPIMGLVTAIWAGLFAAILGGSAFNIVGPTGALSGILAIATFQYGMNVLPILAIFSGLIILIIWMLHLEKYIILIPSSVIHGFTLGIAIILILGQLGNATGIVLGAHEHLLGTVFEIVKNISLIQWESLGVMLGALGLLFGFQKLFPSIPSVILVSLLGLGLGFLSTQDILFDVMVLGDKFQNLSGTLFVGGYWNSLGDIFDVRIIGSAFAIAVIAVLETLLSGRIADKMTKTQFNQRKEVFGLGIANMVSGLMGGIPATAALARTSLNIKSGATSSVSAIINTIILAMLVVIFLNFFQYLPLPVIASVLIYIAIKMVQREHFIKLFQLERSGFVISMIVALITVIQDPIMGVLIGSALSLIFFANKVAQAGVQVTIKKDGKTVGYCNPGEICDFPLEPGEVAVYRFAGELTYINVQSHVQAISQIPSEISQVILSFRNLYFMDMEGIEGIGEMIEILEKKHIKVILTSFNSIISPSVLEAPWYTVYKKKKRIYPSSYEAVKMLQHVG